MSKVVTKLPSTKRAQSKRAAEPSVSYEPLFFGDWEKSWSSPRKRRAFIQQICDRIVAVFQPEKIILFGSQAYGKPTPESDIDLLVVMPFEGRSAIGQAVHIITTLKLCLPLDLFVYSSQQLQERLKIGDRFVKEITDKGKLIFAAPNTGMD
jgi:predicted nucleotidyltransferase